jgi:hypothetical protein
MPMILLLAAVAPHQHRADPLHHLGDDVGAAGYDVDLHELVDVEEVHRAGDRDEGYVVKIEAQHLPLGLHHADDEKCGAADSNPLSQR